MKRNAILTLMVSKEFELPDFVTGDEEWSEFLQDFNYDSDYWLSTASKDEIKWQWTLTS